MTIGQKIQVAVTLLLVVGIGGYLALRIYSQSEARGALLLKWAITGLVFVGVYKSLPGLMNPSVNAIFAFISILLMSIVLAIIWGPELANFVGDRFAQLYTGGGVIEPAPNYSMAEAKRKRNDFAGAVADVRTQLQQFPNDHAGIFLLASIQAENLNDLAAAEETLLTYIRTADPPVGRRSAVLHLLADYHLKYARDSDAARACMQQIIDRHPDTEQATMAAHRLAHLVSTDELKVRDLPRSIEVKRIPIKLGLQKPAPKPVEKEIEAVEAEIEACRNTLELHPLDFETRERLVYLVAEHHGALEEAHREIEYMVRQTAANPRQVKRWLNMHVDLDAKFGMYSSGVEAPLRRLIDMYPGSAAAEAAVSRLAALKTEFRRKETGQV